MLLPQPKEDSIKLHFSTHWDLLGPFQLGTREAAWGADPLECVGGFRSLRPSQDVFHSSLGRNGVTPHSATCGLIVGFPDIDWPFLQSIYGWPALQYQVWARGRLVVEAETNQTVVLYTDRLIEFWVDHRPSFGGDFYALRNAPLVLHLSPGEHTMEIPVVLYRVPTVEVLNLHSPIDLRLIRDVRAMGGLLCPKIDIRLKAEISRDILAVIEDRLIVPDTVNGILASDLASVPVRNESPRIIKIIGVESIDQAFNIVMAAKPSVRILPGQTRPLSFRIAFLKFPVAMLKFRLRYTDDQSPAILYTRVITCQLNLRGQREPHKFTFFHPSNTVSHAILRPPSQEATLTAGANVAWPVVVNLHGAGLDADSDAVRRMFDGAPDLRGWILSPTGMTSWSSDDWHNWGFADVEAAIAAIPQWLRRQSWKGPSVDPNRWLVVGHSNGGQGTWYALTHRPDKIIGASPLSGYSSIQAYVPYHFWTETEPKIRCILDCALSSYRHEVLLENLNSRILQQHGSADDNVSVFHSRRLFQLQSQVSSTAYKTAYVELEGSGHWFDGIMTTPQLLRFYESILDEIEDLAIPPSKFKMAIADPAGMGSKGGIIVDQKRAPGQLGRLKFVQIDHKIWNIETSNISQFHFAKLRSKMPPDLLQIDGNTIKLAPGAPLTGMIFSRSLDGSWEICQHSQRRAILERRGAQLGPLDALLLTKDRFLIHLENSELENSLSTGNLRHEVAVQVSRNLYQYFRADSEIVFSSEDLVSHRGNIVTVAHGTELKQSLLSSYPITVSKDKGVCIRDSEGDLHSYAFCSGLGIVCLRPYPQERLEAVLWGSDSAGLRKAARLLPMLTGTGQPDFVILGSDCAWKGSNGVVAMGFLDNLWNVSADSYIT